jgi:ABC-type branched-subunit amino acid transport system substrate-binding protein
MTMRRVRWLAAALAIGLVAAACGGSSEKATTTTAAPTATTAAGGSTAAPTTTAAPGEKFGDLASPCGKGDAKGATANGVTDTSITIGYGDDAGYAGAPGLNKEMSDAVKSLIKWCNDQGGINGRKVVGNYYDGKILDVKTAMTQACTDKVFMLVGEGWALDSLQEDVRIGCKLPAIPAYSVSTAFAMGPGMIQAVANPGDQLPLESQSALALKFPESIKKVAYVYADYAATLETMEKSKAAIPALGYVDLKCDQIYNIGGEADWKPFAENLKKCGADFVIWVGSPAPNFQNLLTASQQVGFAPKVWFTDANHYDATFAAWNATSNGAGNNVYVRMAFTPFEEASTNKATQQYLDLINKDGGKVGLLGIQASSSWLLWATGVKACGSTVTGKCVFDAIAKIDKWTAGGLQVPMNPSKNAAPTCGMTVKLNGAKWERFEPASGFTCNDKSVATGLATKYVTAAKLDANRVATVFGTFTLS